MGEASSEDYSEIDNAPQFRPTPDVLGSNSWANAENPKLAKQRPFIMRRRSTNYTDALERERNLPEAISNNLNIVKSLDTEFMDQQSNKHRLQEGSAQLQNEDSFFKYDNVETGPRLLPADALVGTAKASTPRSQTSTPSAGPYGITYCDGDKPRNHDEMCEEFPRGAPLMHRRSSLLEDYKKDMYNKQHLFGT
ncbi:LADA_0H17326g1_1 [Lachancea dasiensis]|uniref:LADA_0H17326g1_1 n=1 Tax=Lachancea dasiensis TaxID=1072105 RepID=A0A1G4K5Q6_9SACH|nr:LADA_0H17326g1_1 [Lachancea dasiensis]